MKIKISKAIFIASFIPYIWILIEGIICAIGGFSIFFTRTYGIEAFFFGILVMLYTYGLAIPILPVVLIYQICYIIRTKSEKIKQLNFKKFLITCSIIGAIIVIPIIIYNYSFEIEQLFGKSKAKKMIQNAEVKITYNENEMNYSGIFGMEEYKNDHILIDYDKNEVGFLYNAGNNEYWSVKLKKTTKDSEEYKHIVNTYYMQADIPLDIPGKQLISFYDDKENMHRTVALLLIYQDGSIYYAVNIKEVNKNYGRYTGLNFSRYFVGENIKYNQYDQYNQYNQYNQYSLNID